MSRQFEAFREMPEALLDRAELAQQVERLYAELQEMDMSDWAALLQERREWEKDQAAIAEYESWYLQKLMAEQDAEDLSAQE